MGSRTGGRACSVAPEVRATKRRGAWAGPVGDAESLYLPQWSGRPRGRCCSLLTPVAGRAMMTSIRPGPDMVRRHRVHDIADLREFVERHSQAGLGAAPGFLLELARGPDSVFDLHDAAGRAMVAVLTDRCHNSADAAELVLLACREAPDQTIIATLLDAALTEVRRGPRSSLEVPLGAAMRPHEALLRTRGLASRFAMVTLEQSGPWQPAEPPVGWSWTELTAERCLGLTALIRAAFAGHPGVNFPPPEHGWTHALAKTPANRVLVDGSRLAGGVSVRGEADGSGVVEYIARHPDDRGRGVGAVLLTEAMRQLASHGLQPVRLDAAVANERALRLYQGFGFTVTDTVPIYGVRTAA